MPGQALDPRSLLNFQRKIIDRLVLDRDPLGTFELLCQEVEALLGEGVCSAMSVAEDGLLYVVSAPSAPAELIEGLNGLKPGRCAGTCGTAVYIGAPVLIEDTLSDERWEIFRDAARNFGIRSSWSIPVCVRDGQEISGTLAFSRPRKGLPDAQQLEVLHTGAHLAGLLLESHAREERAARSNQLLNHVLEACQDAIFAKDVEGRYILMNTADARHFGRPVSEMLGKTDFDLFGATEAREIRAMDQRVMKECRTITHQQSYPTWNQKDRVFHVSRSPMLDREGEVVGVTGIVRDVTDLQLAEKAMRRAQHFDSLGVLAGGIAHDFNNLLVGVLGNADYLLQGLPAEFPFREAVLDIDRAAQEGSKLCQQLLSYAGRGEFVAQEVDLHDIVRETARLLSHSLSGPVRVVLKLDDRARTVAGDRTQLVHIVVNLIRNAIEAHGEDSGMVTVRTCCRTIEPGQLTHSFLSSSTKAVDCIVLEVEDTGCGMSAEQVEHAFDPFFSGKKGGHGLGLAAVLGTLNRHAGGVSVESRLGAGTRFQVAFPVPTDRSLERDPDEDSSTSERPQVLLVDDEEVAREVGRRMLQLGGYEVVSCVSGEEALRWAETAAQPPQFVVLDYRMPGLNGLETMARLRQTWPRLEGVLVSGYRDDVARHGQMPACIKSYLSKPFRTQEFLNAVRRCDVGWSTRGAKSDSATA